MPRIVKYDDPIIFKKPDFWGKIMIYSGPSWNILFPIVDIIRILPKQTISTHKYAKNQNIIKLYGSQYSHFLIGIDLIKKQDFIENLKSVKFIFIFSDTQDITADNLISYCEKSKTPLICYSNLDHLYHFYNNDNIIKFTNPEDVIKKMEEIKETDTLNKLNDLFPEFEILLPENKINLTLEKCLNLLNNTKQEVENKKVYTTKLPFDPNFNKLKNKLKKAIVEEKVVKNSLSNFFKK